MAALRFRLRIRLGDLQNRIRSPYSFHWLRRVGCSFRSIGRRSVDSRLRDPRVTNLGAQILLSRSLNKCQNQDRLSPSSGPRNRLGSVRMVVEGTHRPVLDSEDLLEGWKAIADHLDKTERTVQRWEKSKALPVRRLKAATADEQGRVFAYKSELDAWWQEILSARRHSRFAGDLDTTPPETPVSFSKIYPAVRRTRRQKSLVWMAATVALALLFVGLSQIPSVANLINKLVRPTPAQEESPWRSARSKTSMPIPPGSSWQRD